MAFHVPQLHWHYHPNHGMQDLRDPILTHLSLQYLFDPRDIWDEVREVTEGSINVDTKDNTPKNLFQPTSSLNPGYGVLFEHIGQLHQSVYKHYLIIALKIPTLHHMPHEPEQWYKGCEEGKQTLIRSYENLIFKSVFNEDYCAIDRFKHLYTDITRILYSDIPALLPNQEVPYADFQSFNSTFQPMPKNVYHPENPNKTHNRLKRDFFQTLVLFHCWKYKEPWTISPSMEIPSLWMQIPYLPSYKAM